ncbi:MAG TPA: questin oxidase family protein [Thermoanaerobaculia bacterium]|nr:questin oxidase family protein [Thermoanaerobaculia bacterium]
MEDALKLLAGTGPEYDGGLANHGPMAAEALVTLGRPGAVLPWVERYRRRLEGRPSGTRPIAADAWGEALGARDRVGDWIPFFRRRVEERAWREVVREWVPRLSPGIVAAAFHGVIRTAHAARSLAATETALRRFELAEGLAYWAANYATFPASRARAPAGRLPSRALGDVPAVPPGLRVLDGNITERLGPVQSFEPFATVADSVDTSGEPSLFLSDLTETFAGVFLASVPPGSLITFIHGLTGPSALRLLMPHLDAPAKAEALRHAWQGAAALYSAFGGVPPAAHAGGAPPRPDDLIDRAIATADEHAIKFTEACLREHAVNPKPVYLLAARRAVERLS